MISPEQPSVFPVAAPAVRTRRRSKQRVEVLQRISHAIPECATGRSELLRLLGMDLSYVEDPVFSDAEATAAILNRDLSFDPDTLASAWHVALTDANYERTPIARKVLLSRDEERLLFLQYNHARRSLNRYLQAALWRSLTVGEVTDAVQIGRHMKRLRDTIVVANLGLVFSMGRQYNIFAGGEVTELVSEGFEALMRSTDRFNVSKGFKFSTYACRSVIQAMNRHKGRSAVRAAREHPVNWEPGSNEPVAMPDGPSSDVQMLREVLLNNVADLTDCERFVIEQRFFKGAKLADVGEATMLKKEHIRQIQKRAMGKLRSAMTI